MSGPVATLSPSPRQREEGRGQALPANATTIPTYYDEPALKPSLWGWKVSTYMFVSGLAGSAQIIASAADLVGGEQSRSVVRSGRYIALAGAAIGAPLLIIDLHTPQRFYNMLRIFRRTSPMSIGTCVLLSFGGLSALLAFAQWRRDRRGAPGALDVLAKLAEVPAAVTGAAMSTYTGALLTATSTPLWAAAPRLLPAVYGASAMASAAAALSLTEAGAAGKAVERIELVASGVEWVLLWALRRRFQAEHVAGALAPPVPVRVDALDPLLLAASVPFVHQAVALIGGPSLPKPAVARAGIASAAIVLAGAFLLRHLILRGGNRSARRPRDYFRFAGGDNA